MLDIKEELKVQKNQESVKITTVQKTRWGKPL